MLELKFRYIINALTIDENARKLMALKKHYDQIIISLDC